MAYTWSHLPHLFPTTQFSQNISPFLLGGDIPCIGCMFPPSHMEVDPTCVGSTFMYHVRSTSMWKGGNMCSMHGEFSPLLAGYVTFLSSFPFHFHTNCYASNPKRSKVWEKNHQERNCMRFFFSFLCDNNI